MRYLRRYNNVKKNEKENNEKASAERDLGDFIEVIVFFMWLFSFYLLDKTQVYYTSDRMYNTRYNIFLFD